MHVLAARRPSPGIVLIALLTAAALVATACNPDSNRGTTQPGAASGAGASAGASPAASAGGASGTAATSSAPSASGSGEPAASGGTAADISGAIEVGAKYADADEIATVRYDTFTERYPDVDVSFTEADFDAQVFLTSVASGNPPDVVQIGRDIMGTYISQGALEPLDSCISDHGIDMGQYREQAVTEVTLNDQIWGIPQFFDTRILMINQSVIEEVGLVPEDIDTSDWDALREVNNQLLAKEGDNLTRIGFDPKITDYLPLWAAANGARILSEDGTESLLDDPKVAEALDYAASLVLAHGDAPTFFDFRANGPGGAFFGEENQFTEDSLGAMPMESWYLNVLAGDTPDEAIAFQPYKDREGNPITLLGGQAWVIPAASDNKEAACEFAKVVTEAETWVAAATARAETRAADGQAFTGTYTANTAADEQIFSELVTEETAGNYYEGVQLALEVADSAVGTPANPAAEQFKAIWQDAVQRVLDGEPAADVLLQADQEAQDAIDGAIR